MFGNYVEYGTFISLISSEVLALTSSVLQAYCAVITEYGIPSDFVRKLTVLLQFNRTTKFFE